MKRKTKTTNTSLLSESVSCSNLKFDNSMDIVIVCHLTRSYNSVGYHMKTWTLWVEVNVCSCFVFVYSYLYWRCRFNCQWWKGDAKYRFNHATFLCLSQAKTWFLTSYVMVFFMFKDLRWEVIVGFVEIDVIVDHHCLYFLSIIPTIFVSYYLNRNNIFFNMTFRSQLRQY
jgi:hypothetical protein